MKIYSKATGQVNFSAGINRNEAWKQMIDMFKPYVASPIPGKSPVTIGTSKSNGKRLDVGDVYNVSTHADKYQIRITDLTLEYKLSYDLYAGFNNYSYPIRIANTQILGDNKNLILEVTISYQSKGFGFASLTGKKQAKNELEQMIGLETGGSAWLGNWYQLPIERTGSKIWYS